MRFKVKFCESNVRHFVNASSKEKLAKYLKENASNIESFEVIKESVRVTTALIDNAWQSLKRRAKKNYISTQALEAVCYDFSQNDQWSDEHGTDRMAFERLWDELVEKMDKEGYELLDSEDYDKKFGLERGPQTSLDVTMNTMRNQRNAMIRESAIPVVEEPKVSKIFEIVNWLCLNCTEEQEDKLTELSNLLEEVFTK